MPTPPTSTQQYSLNETWLLEPLCVEREPAEPRWVARWTWTFLLLGVAARLIRYALRFPLWEDEAFLSANLVNRGYLDLAGPLDYFQACPLGFLWVQLTAVKLLGFNEYSLRLVPLLCGVASLFLFRHLAGRFLKGTALVLAVAIFSVSYPCIRYAAEAKQYGVELFVSLVLLTLAVEWWRRPEKTGCLWALAALAPPAVWLCYPTVFVGGAISLFVAWTLWSAARRGKRDGAETQNEECKMKNEKGKSKTGGQRPIFRFAFCILHFAFTPSRTTAPRHPRCLLPWLVFNFSMAAAVAALYLVSAQNQAAKSMELMQQFWERGFPPVAQPLALLGWLVDTHAGDLVAYPVGGGNGGSTITMVLCAAAIVLLVRRRRWGVLALWLGPLGLSLAAAVLHRYPYGQMTKFQFFAAATFCLLAGLGAATLALRLIGNRRLSPAAGRIGLLLLVAIGLGSIGRDFLNQAKSATTMWSRDFARWFWFTAQYDGEVACLQTDLHETFSPETFERGFSALYLCNQRIYSPRHARGERVAWDRISAERPLRCVEYRDPEVPYDEAARDRWLLTMQSRYLLVSREQYPFVNVRHQAVRGVDYVEVYKLVPRTLLSHAPQRVTGRRDDGVTR